MFWYSYRGLEPHLQRAHAGHTQDGTSNGGQRPSLNSGFHSRRGWPRRWAENDEDYIQTASYDIRLDHGILCQRFRSTRCRGHINDCDKGRAIGDAEDS